MISLHCLESSLTGESAPNSINSVNAVLLSGCTVKEGIVKSIVVATGL
jgi:magnesium-transporting ATPase (P-type)